MKCPKCKCYTFNYIQNHKEYLELKCARCGNIFKDYINQPTLSSEVEDDLKTLEDWLYRKKSMYTLDGIVILNRLRKILSDKDKKINLLTKSHEDVVIELAIAIEQLNAIEEVCNIPFNQSVRITKIKQILEAQNEKT